MSEYEYEDLGGLGGDDSTYAAPEQQYNITTEFPAPLDGNALLAAAAQLVASPEAQEALRGHAVAEEYATREAAGPMIHSQLDELEASYGTVFDRRAVIDAAEKLVPAAIREFGHTEEAARWALSQAAKDASGRTSYDDVIARHVAKLR